MTEPIFAFLDEYGEEGFTRKASEWLVLSASIQAAEDVKAVYRCYSDFKRRCGRDENWHFHFVKCEHRLRLAFIDAMRPAGYVFMSVAIHKPSIARTDNFTKPYYLYFYAAKLLLERISWMARAQRRHLDTLFFSTRRGLKRENVLGYLDLLRRKDADFGNSIYWPAMDPLDIQVEPNKERIGLHGKRDWASHFSPAL